MPPAADPLRPGARVRRLLRPYLCLAGLTLALALPVTLHAANSAAVGQITFVIGAAHIIDAAGKARAAQPGTAIAAGDRIETGAGQHIHLRFVDGAFLSVRPNSRFTVDRYDTGDADVAIRFDLEHGVVRSITGQAAKLHKDRFRLDTPVAAIGVRGTDFVVQADAAGLRAVVNEGAIVVAPFGTGCAAGALGPCVTDAARELSDTMGSVVLEFNSIGPARIVPLNGTSPDNTAPPAPQEPDTAHVLPAVAETLGATADAHVPADPAPTPAPLPEGALSGPTPLQWGRWSETAREGDTLTAPFMQARAGRRVTLGNDYATLYRTPGDAPQLSAALGQASFALSGAHVSLISPDGAASPGRVDAGALQIDFARRQFATELTLSHPQTGAVGLQAAGSVQADGLFSAVTPETRVAGAVTTDGLNAGFLFDKSVSSGTLSGVTLWRR